MSELEKQLLEDTEFETKYKVEPEKRFGFKTFLEDTHGLIGETFTYIQSGDDYHILNTEKIITKYLDSFKDIKPVVQFRPELECLLEHFILKGLDLPPFLRHRFSDNKKEKRRELTFKKRRDSKNPLNRNEVNLRVDKPPEIKLEEHVSNLNSFVEGLSYEAGFNVYKYCDIYHAPDATLVFYTVKDTDGLHHFIEIEVEETLVATLTSDEAKEIIRKWEKELAFLGIKHQNRLKKTLFDMFKPKIKSFISEYKGKFSKLVERLKND